MNDVHKGMSRRDFGRMAALAGVTGGALIAGASTASAADPVWKVKGTAGAGLTSFDRAMETFMKARNISSGSLAVARQGKLVLARGYSYSTDTALEVLPTSLFRIASISKPITATAILRLVREGKLSLSDRVTDILGLAPADPAMHEVTVLRLLHHLGGFRVSPDPMFSNIEIRDALGVGLPISKAHVVQHMTGQPLVGVPGAAYSYSNYGYLLLGRIIEKVTGQPYATYVRSSVLQPRGITRMKLGRTLLANRAAGEVKYDSLFTTTPNVMDNTGAKLPTQYGGFNLENMDSHGGWLGTAVDLVRFASLYDGPNDVLDAASISQAFAQPETGINSAGWYYGCGWQVRPTTAGSGRNTWHNGSLAGTWTYLVRRNDGLTWSMLFNKRKELDRDLVYTVIDSDMHTAANAVTAWPNVDLYPTYGF